MMTSRPPLSAAGRAMRHRNFRIFFLGELVSITGSWIQYTAQAWLVVTLVGNVSAAFYLGLLGAIQVLPVLVLGLFGGVMADVLPKRRTLILTQSIAGLLALLMGVLVVTGAVQVWHVFVVGLALGVVNAVDIPTRQAIVVEMVGPDDVGNAITLNSAAFNVARIIGPSIGGLLTAAVGMSLCFLLNALSFGAVVVSLLAVRESEMLSGGRLAMPGSAREVGLQLSEGLRYVWRTPVVLLAIAAGGLASTFGMNFNVMVPAMAAGVLNVGPAGFGFLNAAIGVGAVLVAIPVAGLRRPTLRLLVAAILVLGISLGAFALSTSFAMAVLSVSIAGAAGLVLIVTANSLIQMAPPAALRGRVMSVYTTAFIGATPVGNSMIAVLAVLSGTRIAILMAASATLLVGLVAAAVVLGGRAREVTVGTTSA